MQTRPVEMHLQRMKHALHPAMAGCRDVMLILEDAPLDGSIIWKVCRAKKMSSSCIIFVGFVDL
jgi:hypothetical protein